MSLLSNYNLDESFGIYRKEVRQFSMLTASEELELGKRIKEGDLKAREILTDSNLGLVIDCAKKYGTCGISIQDLISYGNEGLIKAVDKYDYRKGIKFSTFASQLIHGEIKSYLRGSLSHIPRNKFPYWLKVKELKNEGHSVGDISRQVGLSVSEIEDLLKYYDPSKNISITVQNENGDEYDLTSDERYSPDSCLNLLREKLFSIIGKYLTSQESDTLRLYHGEDYNLKEVGSFLGITESRACQIKKAALKKVRNPECLSRLEKCLCP